MSIRAVANWGGRTSVLNAFLVIKDGDRILTEEADIASELGLDENGAIVAIRIQALKDDEAEVDQHSWTEIGFDENDAGNGTTELVLDDGRRIDLDVKLHLTERDGLERIDGVVSTDEPGVTVSRDDQPFNFWGEDPGEDPGAD